MKILVVDDDQRLLSLIVEFLIGGYSIVTAMDGEEGLEKFQSDQPDMIITDLAMPKMDGLELIKSVRKLSPDLPILVVTGQMPQDSMVKEARNLAQALIFKPFTMKDLVSAAARVANHRQKESDTTFLERKRA